MKRVRRLTMMGLALDLGSSSNAVLQLSVDAHLGHATVSEDTP
jgi:hypothetical protein